MEFQPTLPARGATGSNSHSLISMKISTHAPRTGSDLGYGYYKRMPQAISTHAPRTGSDKAQRCAPCRRCYFNPRSPHGERRGGMTDDGQRGAISTHAPRTGSDELITTDAEKLEIFQPTLPARGATSSTRSSTTNAPISIHAPRTGSDIADMISV